MSEFLNSPFPLVKGLPERDAHFNVRASLKRLHHSLICATLMESLPKAYCIFQIVSIWVSPSLWQNMVEYRYSRFSVILRKWKYDCWSVHTFTLILIGYWLQAADASMGGGNIAHAHYCPLLLPTKGHQPRMICFSRIKRSDTFCSVLLCCVLFSPHCSLVPI